MTPKVMIIVPAWNEEGAIGQVVRSIKERLPEAPVVVIDDYSEDETATVASTAGARVLRLPVHLGLGGCVQTGYKMAYEMGFDYVIRVDGDGQHEIEDIPTIYGTLIATGAEVVIGSRFIAQGGDHTSRVRCMGIAFFRFLMRPILGQTIRDPTSGFIGVNRRALQLFSRSFPLAWPEIEALMVLQRRRFRFEEASCRMHPRRTGRSSITMIQSFRYMLHVLLGVFINVLKYERSGLKGVNQ